MKIWSQYFITKQLGAKLLGVEKIEDNYLLNLRDQYGFDEQELIEAWEEQNRLIDENEMEFQVESRWFQDDNSSIDYADRMNNDSYVYELSEYIIKQLQSENFRGYKVIDSITGEEYIFDSIEDIPENFNFHCSLSDLEWYFEDGYKCAVADKL